MADSKLVSEVALSALASDIKAALELKANQATTYTKTQVDSALALKADKSDTYTKEETDNEVYNVLPTDTASGSIASFTDGGDNIPVKSLVSQIVAVETGNGQPKSPTNPYTISGYDNAVVSVCGVNIWDEVWELGTLNTTTGANASATTRIRSKNYIPVKPNTTYTYRQGTASGQTTGRVCYYDVNKNFISSSVYFPSETETFNGVATFTTPNNACYMRFSPASGYGTTYGNNISINYPSSDTQYHAYNGNTYTFTFGQTVYGGYFDNNGNLVVTWAAIDLGSLTWTYDSTYARFLSNSFNIDGLPSTRTMKCLCSCYQPISDGRPLAQVPNNSIYNGGGSKTLIVHDNRFTVGTDLKTAVSGQYSTYQLETPITLAITSQDIPTLSGENNIFSNCGDVEVDYHADIGLYIDKKISSLAQG